MSRKPNSNDVASPSNPWGSQNPDFDDIAALLGGYAERCCVCKKVVLNCYLKKRDSKNYCPDHEPKGE